MKIYPAEVRNIKDPYKSGKVQVRIYGLHDDDKNVKDEHLAWATPMQPITSAATGKAGVVPVGMVVGSRVLVAFMDVAQQYPMILGTYSRGAQPEGDDNRTGKEGVKKGSEGVDTPSSGTATSDNMGKAPNHPKLGGEPLKTSDDKYNEAKYVENGKGEVAIDKARERSAPNADEKTTASADASDDLPTALQKTNPNGDGLSMKDMIKLLNLVRMIMSMMGGGGGGGGGAPPPTAAVRKIITNALQGAMALLAKKYGFQKVLLIMDACVNNGGFARIEPDYQQIVRDALTMLMDNANQHGVNFLQLSSTPTVIFHSVNQPVPQPVYGFPPDFYVQQYFAADEDPYPGFVQWKGPTGDIIYTVRSAFQPPFPTMEDHVYTVAEQDLAKKLEPYIVRGSISPEELNAVLDSCNETVHNQSLESTLGQNSSQDIMGLISMLMGIVGQLVNNTKDNHLPQSVLNVGSVENTLKAFSKNMAMVEQMKQKSKSAFAGSPISGALGALASGAGLNIGNLGSVVSTVQSLAQKLK